MDMSLDDYINSFKEPDVDMQPDNCVHESKFKEGRREKNDNEDDDEELVLQCQDDDYVSLALKNDDPASAPFLANDLRNKIVGVLPNANSQQWRLMQPNVMHSRPAGMPPLIPSDTPQHSLNGNRGWRNYNQKNRFSYGRKNWNNNFNNNFDNYNNGRIQRFKMNSRSNLNSKNIKIVLQQLKERNPMILYPEVGASDLTIEATLNNKERSSMFTKFTMPTVLKANLPQVVQPESSPHSRGSDAIKSLLGVSEMGLRNEMMPSLAAKLLDFLNESSQSIHKPVYDMKIQKEIHDIQKKPLLYKCPGGEVVSSDGIGIPDCRIQPKASGVSLNNRFA